MSRYNTHEQHPMIPRDPTYSINRKLITFHTEDRDIVHWPNANEFEVQLPQSLTNVESMRLVEIVLPVNYYNISKELQNTSMQITIMSTPPVSYTITLDDGFYTPAQIANTLTNRIQTALGGNTEFQVHYNEVSQNMWFTFNEEFRIDADVNVVGENCTGQDVPAHFCPQGCDYIEDGSQFQHYTKWGLPFNLGFQRTEYKSQQNGSTAITFDYVTASGPASLSVPTPPPIIVQPNNYYITGTFPISLFGHSVVYMEVEKYNSMDELTPYPQRTNDLYDNDYNGRVNSAFAKIPLTGIPQAQVFESRNGFLQNTSNHFNPPIERIQKLKFRFRYHDGRLVNFKHDNFNFSIAFNELRNEQLKNIIVRVPDTYLMP